MLVLAYPAMPGTRLTWTDGTGVVRPGLVRLFERAG